MVEIKQLREKKYPSVINLFFFWEDRVINQEYLPEHNIIKTHNELIINGESFSNIKKTVEVDIYLFSTYP